MRTEYEKQEKLKIQYKLIEFQKDYILIFNGDKDGTFTCTLKRGPKI